MAQPRKKERRFMGHHEEHHMHIESKIYQTEAEITQYLAEHYSPGKSEVYRSPGSFGHEYLIGKMELPQLLDSLKAAADKGLQCVCCMDERVKVPHNGGGLTFTSHEGCGAAGIMAGQVMDTNNPQFRARYEAVVGKDDTARLVDAFNAAKDSPDATMLMDKAKDAFGAAWSASIASMLEERGVEAHHEHIQVDAEHHYANMTVVDTARVMEVDTKGHVGERAFFVGNPDGLVIGESQDQAYDSMVMYAKLSANIARGGHSSLPKDKPFVITVVQGADFNQAAWDKAWTSDAVAKGEIANGQYTLPHDKLVSVKFITTEKIAAAKQR